MSFLKKAKKKAEEAAKKGLEVAEKAVKKGVKVGKKAGKKGVELGKKGVKKNQRSCGLIPKRFQLQQTCPTVGAK